MSLHLMRFIYKPVYKEVIIFYINVKKYDLHIIRIVKLAQMKIYSANLWTN